MAGCVDLSLIDAILYAACLWGSLRVMPVHLVHRITELSKGWHESRSVDECCGGLWGRLSPGPVIQSDSSPWSPKYGVLQG